MIKNTEDFMQYVYWLFISNVLNLFRRYKVNMSTKHVTSPNKNYAISKKVYIDNVGGLVSCSLLTC